MAKPDLEYDTIEHSEAPTGGDEKFYIERYHWRDLDDLERGGTKVSIQRVFEREDKPPLRKKILPIENDADAVRGLGEALIAQADAMEKDPTPTPKWA